MDNIKYKKFSGTDIQSSEIQDTFTNESNLLIFFFATWCPVCLRAFPTINRLFKEHINNLKIIGIPIHSGNLNDLEYVKEVNSSDFCILIPEEDSINQFNVIGYPTYFLIKPDGTLFKKYVGEAEEIYDQLLADLSEIDL